MFVLILVGQIWDVGTGTLQLSLTGHIEQIRGSFLLNYCWWDCLLLVIHAVVNDCVGNNNWFFAGLAVSSRHTYMFSAGDDKLVKCWDLEQNKVGTSIKSTVFFFLRASF